MNIKERKLHAGKAIKALMKSYNADMVFQNLYKTGTRSIKMYQYCLSGPQDVLKLKEQITDIADMFNLDVRFNTTRRSQYFSPAFIAKL